MMNLRRGNIIKVNGVISEVEDSWVNEVKIKGLLVVERAIYELCPVEITEHYILSNGFERVAVPKCLYFEVTDVMSFKKGIVSIDRYRLGNETIFVIRNDSFSIPIKCVKYVHQLQNCFFNLTGNELHQ